VDSNPDFSVAYYASARQKLDVTYWDYGYPWWPRWGPLRRPGVAMTTLYTEGTLIVDVVDPRSNELLWRGQSKSEVSDDQQEYLRQVSKSVKAILERFPRALPRARPADVTAAGR
jgi:hypothetical protein